MSAVSVIELADKDCKDVVPVTVNPPLAAMTEETDKLLPTPRLPVEFK